MSGGDALTAMMAAETLDPPDRVLDVMEAIRERHPGRVLGFVYYGSSLRALDDPEKMLDFYVLVDSYTATHGRGWRALSNRLIPPSVFYLERETGGVLSTCKYSIITLDEFERRCADGFLSQVWGRFSQPCALLGARDAEVADRIARARAAAVRKIAAETAPLFDSDTRYDDFWTRAYYESYRTELRPESNDGRAREIVERYNDRYRALTQVLYPASEGGTIPATSSTGSGSAMRWFLRRLVGRPIAAARVLNSAATFDGGLDYVLRKVERHSGVRLDVSEAQRRHPVLWSPVLGWKLWRKGAFG